MVFGGSFEVVFGVAGFWDRKKRVAAFFRRKYFIMRMVERMRFKLMTSSMPSRRSNQLS